MGAEAIAALLKWPAIVAGVLALLFGIYKLIQRNAAKGAIAEDDRTEAEASLEAIDRAREAKRKAPGNVADLVKSARRGVRKRKR